MYGETDKIKGRFSLRKISMGSNRIATKLNSRMGFQYTAKNYDLFKVVENRMQQ